jgi:hypothetical protein
VGLLKDQVSVSDKLVIAVVVALSLTAAKMLNKTSQVLKHCKQFTY